MGGDGRAGSLAAEPPAGSADCFKRFLALFETVPGLVVELGSRHVSPGHTDIRGAVPPAGVIAWPCDAEASRARAMSYPDHAGRLPA